MGTVLGDFPEQPQLVPEQIVVRFISQDTGQLTSINDPEGFEEYYLAGTEPTNTVQPLVDASKDGSTRGNNQNVSESLF
jgi:membrane carboxypeptidase/penicillin-binding protein